MVWEGSGEIFLYDGSTTTQLTNNSYEDRHPQINANGYVVWYGQPPGTSGSDWEIFLYDGSTTTQLTNNSYDDWSPQINTNGYVVWYGGENNSGFEIFLYDGSTTTQLTNNSYIDVGVQINANGHVVWYGPQSSAGEIFLYDGSSITPITNNVYADFHPQINDNGYVVWRGDGDSSWEIFLGIPVPDPCADSGGDTDQDDVCGDDDNCPASDLSATVAINGCDTGVENQLLEDGCTISDRILECAAGATKHRRFVRCVKRLTRNLKKAGVITREDKRAIRKCARQADIP